MNELESKPYVPAAETDAEAGDWSFQLNLLRAALILLCALFAVSLWVQVHYLRVERTSLQSILQGYDRDRAMLDTLLVKIGDYSRTHPAFAPIMQKYQIQPPTNAPAKPPAAKPAGPAPATTPKK